MSTIVKLKELLDYLNIKKIAINADININTLYSKFRNGSDLTEQQLKGIRAVLIEIRDLINETLEIGE